jgi:hypothetical protein
MWSKGIRHARELEKNFDLVIYIVVSNMLIYTMGIN